MKVENQQLIEEYYNRIKDKYPDLTLADVKAMCIGPFSYVRKEMESGNLHNVRLKYFGTFLVYPNRARIMLERMKIAFKELRLDSKFYFTKKAMIDKFLNNLEDETENKNK